MTTGTKKWFIASPAYDVAFFLAPPTLAFVLGIVLATTGASERVIHVDGVERRLVGIAIGTLIHAHLVTVFVRSHLDSSIFRKHRVRFVVVPIALFVAIVASPHVAALAIVVATFWDVYHSGAQTFGLCRIYDRNAGRPDDPLGRKLDAVAQQMLYAGPIAAGVSLTAHTDSFFEFEAFEDPTSLFFARIPLAIDTHATFIARGVLAIAAAVVVVYLVYNVRRARRGEGPSIAAVVLITTTGACAIATWGFDSWGEAFFVMNFFHAVQYLALVWAIEGGRLHARTRLPSARPWRMLTLALYLGVAFAYGLWVERLDPDLEAAWALTMVVSLMHFWYDGFIWSVRRGEI